MKRKLISSHASVIHSARSDATPAKVIPLVHDFARICKIHRPVASWSSSCVSFALFTPLDFRMHVRVLCPQSRSIPPDSNQTKPHPPGHFGRAQHRTGARTIVIGRLPCAHARILVIALLCTLSSHTQAQINVTTYHYDNARTGQNTQETVLTPANVNSGQFGKLFSVAVDGYVYAQPLYMANVNIADGTHNVLYVATEHDSLYAIDADDGTVYWQLSFINPSSGITSVPGGDVACGSLIPEIGITSTPVIDPGTGTIYLVATTKESGSYIQRLHAIDIVNHGEKFGGPTVISATVPGTGAGSFGGQISFNPLTMNNRAALLLENGHVVIAWASFCDNIRFQGWVMSYGAGTLAQEAVMNMAPNGSDAGVWMSGDGVAADLNGNLFLATGNGTYDGTDDGNYGDSIIRLAPPSGGTFPVSDWFTPFDQDNLNQTDKDVGSGGLVLLPDLPQGAAHQHLLTLLGKEGKIYLVDRDNMGRFCSACTSADTNIVQEITGVTGILGSPAYWNGNVYWGGGIGGSTLKQFSFNATSSPGMLSSSPVSQSSLIFNWTSAPVISSNGVNNGVLWALDNSTYVANCCQTLYAFDATNLANTLYNSNQAGARDVPGGGVKFTAPVVVNGKVYVGSQSQVTAYGIISATPVAAAPAFSPAPGSYTAAVNVALSDSTSGATIHCTTDGSMPDSTSPVCAIINVQQRTTIRAVAIAPGYSDSVSTSASYQIVPGASEINYGDGFSSPASLTLNGSATLNGTRLRLTGSVANQAGSVFVNTPIDVQSFTTDFSFQQTQALGEGLTFTLQGISPAALGPSGGGLGYGAAAPGGSGGIANSVAVKFDIFDENGEGTNSTGMYTNGASPTTPATDLSSSGVYLRGGAVFNVHLAYDGTTLTMTITDANSSSATFTQSWVVNIPNTVGGNTAYIGFTGSTGKRNAIQEIIDWTYVSNSPAQAGPITTFVSSLNPSYVNQPVTFTATVTAQSGGGIPTGTVAFKNGANTMATVPLNNGMASYVKTFPAAGNRPISVAYSGDAGNAGSTSSVLSQVVNALPAPTTTQISASSSPSFIAQNVTFTATVTSPYGPIPDGELVTFKDMTTTPVVVLGSAPLAGGVATFSTNTLARGTHSIKAKYVGDSTLASTTATLTQVVQRWPTTTALSSSLNPAYFGQPVTLTAQVTGNGTTAPTGTVSFYNGATLLGTVTLNPSGIAQWSTSMLPPGTVALPSGTNALTAVYNRDDNNATSTSAVLNQVVNQAAVTMNLSSTPDPSAVGQSVTFTATLTSLGSPPTSAVTFAYGTSTLGTASIVNGVAVLTTPALPRGTDQVTASYAGNANHTPASASVSQQVN